MKSRTLSLLIVTGVVSLVSCKKEAPTNEPGNPMIGDWKFISMTTTSKSIRTVSDGSSEEKAITTSGFTTINNGGTYVISANSFSGTGITYEVKDTIVSHYYLNNELEDSATTHFNLVLIPYSEVANYTLVGQDSITMTDGGMFSSLGSTTGTGTFGSKLFVNGNTLTVTSKFLEDDSSVESGEVNRLQKTASVVVTLQKL